MIDSYGIHKHLKLEVIILVLLLNYPTQLQTPISHGVGYVTINSATPRSIIIITNSRKNLNIYVINFYTKLLRAEISVTKNILQFTIKF